MLDLNQKKFNETLIGQPDNLSESIDHGATGTGIITICLNSASNRVFVIFKRIYP